MLNIFERLLVQKYALNVHLQQNNSMPSSAENVSDPVSGYMKKNSVPQESDSTEVKIGSLNSVFDIPNKS